MFMCVQVSVPNTISIINGNENYEIQKKYFSNGVNGVNYILHKLRNHELNGVSYNVDIVSIFKAIL